jgi:hypothetical protein
MPPARQSTKHNNGEITITPIGMNNNSRGKDYSMVSSLEVLESSGVQESFVGRRREFHGTTAGDRRIGGL